MKMPLDLYLWLTMGPREEFKASVREAAEFITGQKDGVELLTTELRLQRACIMSSPESVSILVDALGRMLCDDQVHVRPIRNDEHAILHAVYRRHPYEVNCWHGPWVAETAFEAVVKALEDVMDDGERGEHFGRPYPAVAHTNTEAQRAPLIAWCTVHQEAREARWVAEGRDPSDLPSVYECVLRWLDVVFSMKKHRMHTPRSLETSARHSLRGGLLGWLCDGNEPLDHAPPTYMSRPWHQLVVDGRFCGPSYVRAMRRHPLGPRVLIGQHPWVMLEDKSPADQPDTRFIVGYREGERWLLHLVEKEAEEGLPGIWDLDRITPTSLKTGQQ